jgi:hypothetical protein
LRRAAALLAALGLAACAHAPPEPVVRTVEVPVVARCSIDPPQADSFAVDALPIGSGIWDQMAALRAERLQRKAYEARLSAALDACRR